MGLKLLGAVGSPPFLIALASYGTEALLLGLPLLLVLGVLLAGAPIQRGDGEQELHEMARRLLSGETTDGGMKEHRAVVLCRPVADFGLESGDVGAVVHCHPDDSYEVEFVTGEGDTVAVITLQGSDLRPIESREILHVRTLHVAE